MAETISSALQGKLAGDGGLARSYVEVWQAGIKRATLDVLDGTVTFDRTASVFRSLSCTLAGFDSIIPNAGELQPAGTFSDTNGTFGDGIFGDHQNRAIRALVLPAVSELRAFMVVTLDDESEETVSLGRYICGSTDFSHTNKGITVTITGYDLLRSLALAGYMTTIGFAQGTNVSTAFSTLVQNRVPSATVIVPSTTFTTARMAFLPVSGANPRADADRLAALGGWVVRTRRTGEIEAFPPPSVSGGSSVWSIDEAVIVDGGTSWDDEGAVNTLVVDGQTSENHPVREWAQMTGGQWGADIIGPRTKYVTLEGPTTHPQASAMAIALLPAYTGISDQVTLRVPPLFHIDPWDLVDVSDAELDLEDTVYMVDRVVISLTLDTGTQVTVSRRLA